MSTDDDTEARHHQSHRSGSAFGCSIGSVYAQVPAGVPFEPGKASESDRDLGRTEGLQEGPFREAAEKVGVELMSLSRDEGERTRWNWPPPSTGRQRIRNYGEEYEATFYPVMRQTYKLKSGNTFPALYLQISSSSDHRGISESPPRSDVLRAASRRGLDRCLFPSGSTSAEFPGCTSMTEDRRTIYWFELVRDTR